MNYIRKINKKYLDEFAFRVTGELTSLIRATDTMFLKVIMDEVNRLFTIMSNRMSVKHDIFNDNDFPDSDIYNRFLDNLDIDLTKLYAAENVIVDDLQNLVNFNSLERDRMIDELSFTQKIVYHAFLKSKKNMSGNLVIREDFDTDILPAGSLGVQINTESEMLTLKVLQHNLDRSVVDYEFVDITFDTEAPPKYKIFPNSASLYVGSFWKKESNDPHYKYKRPKISYKGLMSDEPKDDGMGATEFEKVFTPAEPSIRRDVEQELSKHLNMSHYLIMIDKQNAMHGKYLYDKINNDFSEVLDNTHVIVSIPYTNNAPVSTSAIVNFQANDANVVPTIDYSQSYIYDNTGRKIALLGISQTKLDKYQKTGKYYFVFGETISPARLELSLRYSQSGWNIMKRYFMSHWLYEQQKKILIATNMTGFISVLFKRAANICVDSESNISSEQNRVRNIMSLKGIDK